MVAAEEADTIFERTLASERTSEAIRPVEGAAASILLRTDSALRISETFVAGIAPVIVVDVSEGTIVACGLTPAICEECSDTNPDEL